MFPRSCKTDEATWKCIQDVSSSLVLEKLHDWWMRWPENALRLWVYLRALESCMNVVTQSKKCIQIVSPAFSEKLHEWYEIASRMWAHLVSLKVHDWQGNPKMCLACEFIFMFSEKPHDWQGIWKCFQLVSPSLCILELHDTRQPENSCSLWVLLYVF